MKFQELDRFLLSKNNRIIHQIWFTTIQSKSKTKKMYNSLKLYRNSWDKCGWNRYEWTKENCLSLIRIYYKKYYKMFKSYPYEIQRCDVARYFILHRYGGVYADMDYYCNKNINDIFKEYNNDVYFVETPNTLSNEESVSNSLIYSKRKHPFWEFLFEELMEKQNNIYLSRHFTIMFTTGPCMIANVYNRYKYKLRLKSLPWKRFHPYGINDDVMKLKDNPDIYAIHLGKGSWEENDSRFWLFIYKEWRILLFIIIVSILPLVLCKN